METHAREQESDKISEQHARKLAEFFHAPVSLFLLDDPFQTPGFSPRFFTSIFSRLIF